jgi:hypothetical protein
MDELDAQIRPKRRLLKWLLIAGAAVFLLAAGLAGVAAWYLHRAEPMLRAALIQALEKRFHGRVELDGFHVSALDGFEGESDGLRIWLPQAEAGEDASQPWFTQPWITVQKLRFHASWRMRPGTPVEISLIHVEGVRILLPPKADRPHLSLSGAPPSPESDPNASDQARASLGGLLKVPRVVIKQIECRDVQLIIERSPVAGAVGSAIGAKPSAGKSAADTAAAAPVQVKAPLDFVLARLLLTPDGRGGPIAYEVEMINPKPVGQVHATGHVGPWIAVAQTAAQSAGHFDPGAIPVDGDYHFDHADLSTIKGISGILSSTGHFAGDLRQIVVDGQTQTPDFRLERVGDEPGLPLATRFHATVDGTNGNVWLDPVDATLAHTHIVARGEVVQASDGKGGWHGHDVTLEVTIDHGRMEDFLKVSSTSDAPFLTGDLTLSNHFHLPPGEPKVLERLELDGNAHLTGVRFSNAKVQSRITQLSLRGQGDPQGLKTADPTTVLSEMQSHFKLAGGVLTLPDLVYQVPGAEIDVHGAYGFNGGTLSFDGDAKLQAPLSKIVGGWKGFLLKPADRFLRKNGAGTDVPIHLTGTRSAPKFGVDLDRLGKSD